MNIAFDGKRYFNNSSGLGVYSRTLFKSLKEYLPEHQYKLIAHERYLKKSAFYNPNLQESIVKSSAIVPALWRTYDMGVDIDQLGFDVFHGLSNELPQKGLKEVKKVVTIHDLIAYKNPQWFGKVDAKILKAKVEFAIEKADSIIVPSEYVLQDVERYFSYAVNKTSVIYEAIDDIRTASMKPLTDESELPKDYYLFVGNYNVRKNFTLLLEAMAENEDLCIVAILGGDKAPLRQKKIQERFEKERRLRLLNYVSESELKYLYEQANALIYPSLEEGFGLPVLEAMNNDCAVITTRDSSMAEIAGESGIYIDPRSKEQLLDAIRQIENSNVKNKLIESMRARRLKFMPEKMAKETFQVYAS